jgi:hypothetical protein
VCLHIQDDDAAANIIVSHFRCKFQKTHHAHHVNIAWDARNEPFISTIRHDGMRGITSHTSAPFQRVDRSPNHVVIQTPTGNDKEGTRTYNHLIVTVSMPLEMSHAFISRLVVQSDHAALQPPGNLDNQVISSVRYKGWVVGRAGGEHDICCGEQGKDLVFECA